MGVEESFPDGSVAAVEQSHAEKINDLVRLAQEPRLLNRIGKQLLLKSTYFSTTYRIFFVK